MKNKKGMYFTLMTIAFLSIFIFIFMIPSYKRLGEKMTVIEMRIDSMNDFIKALERDTERGLYISSFRAILCLEEYIINNGEFLLDVKANFTEALLTGNISNKNCTFMKASTFPLWIAKMQEEALNFNIEANITLHNISINQTDPWHVDVSANLTFFIKDVTDIASWKIHETINTSVKITSFEDPFYIIKTYGRTTNLINITPFEGNYTFKVNNKWNVTNLLIHTENSYYTHNPDAPNFLQRFEKDNFAPSTCCGIETLVNLKKLADLGLEICSTCSIVDHYYWQDASGNFRINYTPSWFKLDSDHLEKYNVTKISCEIGQDCISTLVTS